jgi:hypothetical protein
MLYCPAEPSSRIYVKSLKLHHYQYRDGWGLTGYGRWKQMCKLMGFFIQNHFSLKGTIHGNKSTG